MKNNVLIGLLVTTVVYVCQTYYFIFGDGVYTSDKAFAISLLTLVELFLLITAWMHVDEIVELFGGE